MITSFTEIVIEVAALVSGIGGVAFIVYFLALVWREHRDAVTSIEQARDTWRTRHAAHEPEPARPALTLVPSASPGASRAVPHHP